MFVTYEDARGANLIAGNVYGAGSRGNAFADDAISNLFPKLGTQSGFRKKLCEKENGRKIEGEWAYIALDSSGAVPEWPNSMDEDTGIFTYYGDQYDLSKNILDTKQKGNKLLEDVFEWLHTGQYSRIPPFFIFERVSDGNGAVRFLGLAVPGNKDIPFGEDLQRVKDEEGNELNNYVAKFTILDTSKSQITHQWLQERIKNRDDSASTAPKEWNDFIEKGLPGVKPSKFDEEAYITEIEASVPAAVDGKTREAIIKTRANQDVFRKRILKRYSSCCLCGICNKELLTASHIKPWSVSKPSEKLDADNGLLLCPDHDKLFDKGYISFENDGSIMISEKLSEADKVLMNVNNEMTISLTSGNQAFLEYHRKKIFLK